MDVKKLLEATGVSVAEMGALCGVTRMSVFNWTKGAPIDPLRLPKVQKIHDALMRGVEAGDLPASLGGAKGRKRKEIRSWVIKSIVIKYLQEPPKST